MSNSMDERCDIDLANIPKDVSERAERIARHLHDYVASLDGVNNNFDIAYAALLLAGANMAMMQLSDRDHTMLSVWAGMLVVDYKHQVRQTVARQEAKAATKQ